MLAVLSVTTAIADIVPPVTNGGSIVPLLSATARATMDIDPHSVSFYNTFMKLGFPVFTGKKLNLTHVEFFGLPPFFGGFYRPDHDPPHVF
jgi:hypothetical protein